MTYLLICEGFCNVQLPYIDRLVANAPRVAGLPSLPAFVIAAQRTLQHTPHEMVTDDTAKCLQCGRARRYGGVAVGYSEVSQRAIARMVAQ